MVTFFQIESKTSTKRHFLVYRKKRCYYWPMQKISSIPEKIRAYGIKNATLKVLRIFLSSYYFKKPIVRYLFNKIVKGGATCNVNGDQMFLDLKGDEGVSKDLFFYGKREIPVTDYMTSGKIVKPGDVVLDLGANIGYYVILESRIVGASGIVYAVEPVTECFKSLKKNVELNNLKNVQLFQFGAGDTNTNAFINVGKKLNLSAMTFYRDAEFTQQEEVAMVTVDEFFKDKREPNLIRMDVEGYEYAIVKGMKKTLASPNLKLLMEIHSKIMTKEQTETMFASFKENGFTKGVIFKYPPQTWLNKKLEVRPIIARLNKSITNDRLAHEISVSSPMSLDELFSELMNSYAGYNVLLWKEKA